MRIVFVLLSVLIIPILCLFLGLQVIALGDFVKSGYEQEFRIIYDIGRYKEYPDFLFSVFVLIGIIMISFLMSVIFSATARSKWKTRFLLVG